MTTTREIIRLLRKQQSLSQEEMAEKLGMSKNGYGKLERGESGLSLSKLEQIANVFNIDIAEIISNKEMALVTEERHDAVKNNYVTADMEIEKLKLIIQHQQERIEDLKRIIAQKDDYMALFKKFSGVTTEKLSGR